MGYLYRALDEHDVVFWTIAVLCGTFWLLPIFLKFSRTLTWLALISFCNLTFISVFGSFFYGGVSSPFLPWCLAALLIGFFYIGDRPLLVVIIFAGCLVGFCTAYLLNGSFPERVPLSDLSTVGMVSVLCATLYTSMMAVYYAYVMTAQSALRQEIEKRLLTAAKLERAKQQAERANEAKAVFIAKMNHQLRTPLNAIIGYSEILLEDIELDAEPANEVDLKTINAAGRHLLSLVSDVLYMPKIESDNVEIFSAPDRRRAAASTRWPLRAETWSRTTATNSYSKNPTTSELSKPTKRDCGRSSSICSATPANSPETAGSHCARTASLPRRAIMSSSPLRTPA